MKNVLITGASSGIGRECALSFASEGYRVFAISRSIEEKEESHGKGVIISYKADVTDRTSIEHLKEKISDVDIIIHAAGFGIAGSAEEVGEDLIKAQFDVNYLGPIIVNSVFLPLMREKRDGLIIFISSIAARVAIPFQSHYSSSKAALESYALALAMEVKSFGIKVSILEPGDTKTGFTSKRQKYIPYDSPYFHDANRAIEKMERDEEGGKDAKTVSNAALKMAKKKKPKLRLPIGADYSLLMLLARILPDKIVLKILSSMYLKR